MDKKINAAFITMLFLLGIFAIPVSFFSSNELAPAEAHFTVGNWTSSYPFRTLNFDPHARGAIGYVFPGSGLYTGGSPGLYTKQGEYPGYQSPWPYQTKGISNPYPVQGPSNWYQLDANNYAPFGAIMTSTVKAGTPFTTMWKANRWSSDNPTIESLEIEHAVKGDLILAFNVSKGQKMHWKEQLEAAFGAEKIFALNFTGIEIMVPPEFTGIKRQNIVSSFTNNYDNVVTSVRGREDYTYGPYWTRVRVYTDTYAFMGGDQQSADKMDEMPDAMLKPNGPFEFSPWKTFGNITFSLQQNAATDYADEWYYIRINDVTAPTIAGAYFFKFRRMFSPDPLPPSNNGGFSEASFSTADSGRRAQGMQGLAGPSFNSYYFPAQNYPVVLVKGEVDPAIITGTIRYGGWNSTMYGTQVTLPGRIRAVGIADDPYTGKSTGRPVEARGYFNDTAKGHYEVEGVAPGVYDLYASAAGYPEQKIASNVKLLKGQSFHLDGYLTPGVQIAGTVFSKCGTGEVNWGGDLALSGAEKDIKIEIYRSLDDAQSMLPGGSTSKAVTWSPYQSAGSWSAYSFMWTINAFSEAATRHPSGVGPTQPWTVDTTKASFDFQFGRKGLYGAPADLDGHLPLDFRQSSSYGASWVSGVGAGTYWIRAWLYSYVQAQVDGVTFDVVTFTVPSIEWPGNIYRPFDLRLSSRVKKTVHFHDVPGTLMENPIGWGWDYKGYALTTGQSATLAVNANYYRYLAAELVASGTQNYKNQLGEAIYAWKLDPVEVSNTNYAITIRGFKEFGIWAGQGRNYGIPSGLYTVKAYMWGYVEQVFEKVNLGLCGTEASLSDHLYRGARFNISLYSKDWQHPTADKTWSFPYMPIYVEITKDGSKVLAPISARTTAGLLVNPVTMQGFGNTSVAMWPYLFNNPVHLIKTHNFGGQVAGPIGAGANPFGVVGSLKNAGVNWNFITDYFGPAMVWNPKYDLRLYDGSENYYYYYYFPSSTYGTGYTVGIYPLSFESGLYSFKALTYGYVQKKPVEFYAMKGNATSDIMLKLTQGAELDLTIKFKHEGVFETSGIPFDSHLRIRILDDANKVVGEYLTSDWWWQPQYEASTNTLWYNWNLVARNFTGNPTGSKYDPIIGNARADRTNGHRAWNRLNYVPQGTSTVRVRIAGIPDMYGWNLGYSCDPCAATGDFGYEDRPIDAPYGIDAYPNYKGGWRVQVNMVPVFDYYPGHLYNRVEVNDARPVGLAAPNTQHTAVFSTAPTTPLGFDAMLTGELTYTADMKPVYTNHLGPYELRYDVVVPGTHLGGESSLIFELDRRGLAYGFVFGYTYCDDWRTFSWVPVRFTAADGTNFDVYSFDGRFASWLNAGPYTASVVFWTPSKGEGFKVQTMPYHVSDGVVGGFNVYLEQSGVPIPEFPVSAIVLASALAASLFILRRKRK